MSANDDVVATEVRSSVANYKRCASDGYETARNDGTQKNTSVLHQQEARQKENKPTPKKQSENKTLRKTPEERLSAKRAANRKSAFNCRQRQKQYVEALRKHIEEKYKSNAEIRLSNEGLTAHLKKLENENELLMSHQKQKIERSTGVLTTTLASAGASPRNNFISHRANETTICPLHSRNLYILSNDMDKRMIEATEVQRVLQEQQKEQQRNIFQTQLQLYQLLLQVSKYNPSITVATEANNSKH